MSLTYRIWEEIAMSIVPWINFSFPFTTCLVKLLLITYSTRQKRRGERGSLLLTPLVQEKKPCNLPSIEIDGLADKRIE